jgi:hypothetical protein
MTLKSSAPLRIQGRKTCAFPEARIGKDPSPARKRFVTAVTAISTPIWPPPTVKRTMNAIKKSVLLAGICLLAALGTSRAEVTLSLRNNGNDAPNLTIAPGDSFSLNAVVAGLTSLGLGHFELLFAPLPTGLTLSSFTDTLLSGWFTGPLDTTPNQWGGVYFNYPDTEFIGTATLVRANFTTSGSLSPGNYTIDFVPTSSPYQVLQAPVGPVFDIPYTDSSFSLTVVPEPSTALVACALVGVIALYGYRRRALAKASIRVRS